MWVVYTCTKIQPVGYPVAVLYSLNYERKKVLDGYGMLYQNLSTCAVRFQAELISLDEDVSNSSRHGAYCFGLQSINTTISIGGSLNENLEESISLCCITWNGWSSASNRLKTYMSLFDLNQWYKEQMPSTPRIRGTETYMSNVCLNNILQNVNSNSILDTRININTLKHFVGSQRLEEHYYPSSLAFQMYALSECNVISINNHGTQRAVLSHLETGGALALIKPTSFFQQVIQLGLLPLFVDTPLDMSIAFENQREVLLSVALEQKLLGWLCRCSLAWADGSYSSAGCTLNFILNWGWQRAQVLKKNADSFCVSLFDYSGFRLDSNTHNMLSNCARQLRNLSTLFDYIIQKCFHTELNTESVKYQWESLQMAAIHLEVLLWLLNMGLLPECSLSSYPRTDELNRISAPYSIDQLTKYYNERRAFLQSCSKEQISLTQSYLFIDNFINFECGGANLQQQWQQDGGTGLYPPPSLQALLRTYLVQHVDISTKHCAVVYLFLDVITTLDHVEFKYLITNLLKFPAVFHVAPGTIKITQGFWKLDHGDFVSALELLLDPLVSSGDFKLWQHRVALKALVAQEQYYMALSYLQVRRPSVTDVADLCTVLSLFVSNNMIDDAFYFQRKNRSEETFSILLEHFYKECDQCGVISFVLRLPLTVEEKIIFTKYLQLVKHPKLEDLLRFNHLQQSRPFPQETGTIWKAVEKPTPLSVLVHSSRKQVRYKSTSIHADLILTKENVKQTPRLIRPRILELESDDDEPSPCKRFKPSPRFSMTSPEFQRDECNTNKLYTPIIKRKIPKQSVLFKKSTELWSERTPQSILKVRTVVTTDITSSEQGRITPEEPADTTTPPSGEKLVKFQASEQNDFHITSRKPLPRTPRPAVHFNVSKSSSETSTTNESEPSKVFTLDAVIHASITDSTNSEFANQLESSEGSFYSPSESICSTQELYQINEISSSINNTRNVCGEGSDKINTQASIIPQTENAKSPVWPKSRKTYRASLSDLPVRSSPRLKKKKQNMSVEGKMITRKASEKAISPKKNSPITPKIRGRRSRSNEVPEVATFKKVEEKELPVLHEDISHHQSYKDSKTEEQVQILQIDNLQQPLEVPSIERTSSPEHFSLKEYSNDQPILSLDCSTALQKTSVHKRASTPKKTRTSPRAQISKRPSINTLSGHHKAFLTNPAEEQLVPNIEISPQTKLRSSQEKTHTGKRKSICTEEVAPANKRSLRKLFDECTDKNEVFKNPTSSPTKQMFVVPILPDAEDIEPLRRGKSPPRARQSIRLSSKDFVSEHTKIHVDQPQTFPGIQSQASYIQDTPLVEDESKDTLIPEIEQSRRGRLPTRLSSSRDTFMQHMEHQRNSGMHSLLSHSIQDESLPHRVGVNYDLFSSTSIPKMEHSAHIETSPINLQPSQFYKNVTNETFISSFITRIQTKETVKDKDLMSNVASSSNSEKSPRKMFSSAEKRSLLPEAELERIASLSHASVSNQPTALTDDSPSRMQYSLTLRKDISECAVGREPVDSFNESSLLASEMSSVTKEHSVGRMPVFSTLSEEFSIKPLINETLLPTLESAEPPIEETIPSAIVPTFCLEIEDTHKPISVDQNMSAKMCEGNKSGLPQLSQFHEQSRPEIITSKKFITQEDKAGINTKTEMLKETELNEELLEKTASEISSEQEPQSVSSHISVKEAEKVEILDKVISNQSKFDEESLAEKVPSDVSSRNVQKSTDIPITAKTHLHDSSVPVSVSKELDHNAKIINAETTEMLKLQSNLNEKLLPENVAPLFSYVTEQSTEVLNIIGEATETLKTQIKLNEESRPEKPGSDPSSVKEQEHTEIVKPTIEGELDLTLSEIEVSNQNILNEDNALLLGNRTPAQAINVAEIETTSLQAPQTTPKFNVCHLSEKPGRSPPRLFLENRHVLENVNRSEPLAIDFLSTRVQKERISVPDLTKMECVLTTTMPSKEIPRTGNVYSINIAASAVEKPTFFSDPLSSVENKQTFTAIESFENIDTLNKAHLDLTSKISVTVPSRVDNSANLLNVTLISTGLSETSTEVNEESDNEANQAILINNIGELDMEPSVDTEAAQGISDSSSSSVYMVRPDFEMNVFDIPNDSSTMPTEHMPDSLHKPQLDLSFNTDSNDAFAKEFELFPEVQDSSVESLDGVAEHDQNIKDYNINMTEITFGAQSYNHQEVIEILSSSEEQECSASSLDTSSTGSSPEDREDESQSSLSENNSDNELELNILETIPEETTPTDETSECNKKLSMVENILSEIEQNTEKTHTGIDRNAPKEIFANSVGDIDTFVASKLDNEDDVLDFAHSQILLNTDIMEKSEGLNKSSIRIINPAGMLEESEHHHEKLMSTPVKSTKLFPSDDIFECSTPIQSTKVIPSSILKGSTNRRKRCGSVQNYELPKLEVTSNRRRSKSIQPMQQTPLCKKLANDVLTGKFQVSAAHSKKELSLEDSFESSECSLQLTDILESRPHKTLPHLNIGVDILEKTVHSTKRSMGPTNLTDVFDKTPTSDDEYNAKTFKEYLSDNMTSDEEEYKTKGHQEIKPNILVGSSKLVFPLHGIPESHTPIQSTTKAAQKLILTDTVTKKKRSMKEDKLPQIKAPLTRRRSKSIDSPNQNQIGREFIKDTFIKKEASLEYLNKTSVGPTNLTDIFDKIQTSEDEYNANILKESVSDTVTSDVLERSEYLKTSIAATNLTDILDKTTTSGHEYNASIFKKNMAKAKTPVRSSRRLSTASLNKLDEQSTPSPARVCNTPSIRRRLRSNSVDEKTENVNIIPKSSTQKLQKSDGVPQKSSLRKAKSAVTPIDMKEAYTTSRRLTRRQASLIGNTLDSVKVNAASSVLTIDSNESEHYTRVPDVDNIDPIILLDKQSFEGKPDSDEERFIEDSPVSTISESAVSVSNRKLRSRSSSQTSKISTRSDITGRRKQSKKHIADTLKGASLKLRLRSQSVDEIMLADSPAKRITRSNSKDVDTTDDGSRHQRGSTSLQDLPIRRNTRRAVKPELCQIPESDETHNESRKQKRRNQLN